MLRANLILGCALSLAACGCQSSGPNLAGTWVASHTPKDVVLILSPDSSFHYKNSDQDRGRWDYEDGGVVLHKDVRNGGDTSFGEGENVAHLKLSNDAKTLSGVSPDGDKLEFKRQ